VAKAKSKASILDPATFCRWWQMRNLPHDRVLLKAAIAAGLVSRGGDMISLTWDGHTLQMEHIQAIQKAARRAELEAELKALSDG
jgi:hypothetical protein